MAVDPDSLPMPPPPVSWPPDVIRVASVITRPANVIRPIANRNRYGARITSIIRPTISTIVGCVITRVTSVIFFAAGGEEHPETQGNTANKGFHFHTN